MAETKTDGLFGKSTMSRISSADDLDHYVKVTNPSAWVILVAALLLVGGILVWAVVAVIPITVNATGVLMKDSQGGKPAVLCAVDKSTAEKIVAGGAVASIGDIETDNVKADLVPVSSAEVANFLNSDFLASKLNPSDWNYMVNIVLDEEPKHSDYIVGTDRGDAYLVPISIVVSETRPINILLGKK